MNDDLNKWKGLYQKKEAKEIDTNALLSGFNRVEKKHRIERIILTIFIPITIMVLIIVMPVISNSYYLVSVMLMSTAMLFILRMIYRNKFSTIELTQKFNNKKFIENKILKLKNRILLTSRDMWIYAILLILGINIGYIEALHYFSWPIRLLGHVGVSGLMIVGFYFGIKNKLKEYDLEIVPLIKQLESLKNEY